MRDPKKELSGNFSYPLPTYQETVFYPLSHDRKGITKPIHQLFAEQAAKTPDRIAVVGKAQGPGHCALTYRELNHKSHQLAAVLQEKGVRQEMIVGIMVERSINLVVGIMGILKAGAAFLPIDPDYPQERIQYMLNDSGVKILVTAGELVEKINIANCQLSIINCRCETGDALSRLAASAKSSPRDSFHHSLFIDHLSALAYILYTSGSTGKPKGVMIEHRGVVNLAAGHKEVFKADENERISQVASIGFGAAIFEIFPCLLCGASLYIVDNEIRLTPAKLKDWLIKTNITMTFQSTAVTELLLRMEWPDKNGTALRKMRTAGERLTLSSHTAKPYPFELYNLYGSTEDTVWTTWSKVSLSGETGCNRTPGIGVPIRNKNVYILDKEDSLLSVGAAGELCITGVGLARGYLNRPGLTAEKFVGDLLKPGERMYRTGDLCRRIPDGNIEFISRMDNQVKIRGYRIEIGEVESILLQQEGVKEGVVTVREEETGKVLCGYVVCDGDDAAVQAIRQGMRKVLPDYMVPAYFVKIETLPLTLNGKVDRKKLPDPSAGVRLREYEAPGDNIEKKLAKIWQDVLGLDRVSLNDDFFTIGGHSLKAADVVAKVFKRFNKVIQIKNIFENSTVKELAKLLKKKETKEYKKIEKIEKREYYPTSSQQKRLYALQQWDRNGITYNMPFLLLLKGKLDTDRLEAAVSKLIMKHEVFRTVFEMVDGEPVQEIRENVEFAVQYDYMKEEGLEEIIDDFIKAFDLSRPPLLRLKVVKTKKEEHVMLMDMHHIISDGVSMGLIMKDLSRIYQGEKITEPGFRYIDYAVWQKEKAGIEEIRTNEGYWLKKFEDHLPVLNLPMDYSRTGKNRFDGDTIRFRLGKDITERINKRVDQYKVTLYMFLLAVYKILLSRYGGEEDIIVGTGVACREQDELKDIVGMFANTLPIRSWPQQEKGFPVYLNELKNILLEDFEHQLYRFEELVDKIEAGRDINRNPIFDTAFVMENMEIGKLTMGNIEILPIDYNAKAAKFDITVYATENEEGINFQVDYCTGLFKRETMEKLVAHYKQVIETLTMDPEQEIGKIDILTVEEKKRLLDSFSGREAAYPACKTIHELFEEQVGKTPDHIAVIGRGNCEGQEKAVEITYKELNRRAVLLAAVLQNKGVKQGVIVGIMTERSIDLLVGITAILKAGGGFLPIDPNYPQERIQYMLNDSGVKVLVTTGDLVEKIKIADRQLLIINCQWAAGDNVGISLAGPQKVISSLAYIIYTSGSTGKPKGVMIEHRGVINLIANHKEIFKEDKHTRMSQVSSIGFDAVVFEIFPCILNGAVLDIAGSEVRTDPVKLKDWLIKMNITVTFQSTAIAEALLETIWPARDKIALRKMRTAGDRLTRLPRRQYPFDFFNLYGPTEDTVWTTWVKVDMETQAGRAPDIGKPIKNKKVYIFDKGDRLQPVGVPGELGISGSGLARGYLNRPALTAEKFTANPFDPGERMYRTGDLCRWLPEGDIEFIGRNDEQVKIRGCRIEIGEVESVLLKQEGVKEAVVTVREEGTGKDLCGFVTCRGDVKETAQEIRKGMLKTLPDYMVPAYIVKLEALPLTPNGKIDRKKLPDPGARLTEVPYEAPRDDVEKKMAEVWKEVLGIDKVGIDDNFFMIGGDSIKAIQVAVRLRNIEYKLEVSDLLKDPTIRKAVEKVKIEDERDVSEVTGEMPLTPFQQSFMEELTTETRHQSRWVMLSKRDGFNEEAVKKVLEKLIEHHDALRAVLANDEKGLIIKGVESGKNFFNVYNLRMGMEIEKEAAALQKSIDLKEGPLMKTGLFKRPEGDLLLMVAHPLVVDSVSWRILLEDFETGFQQALRGKEIMLPKKTRSFKRWSEELKRYGGTRELKKQYQYWEGLCREAKKTGMEGEAINPDRLREAKESILELDETDTGALLEEVNEIYGTETDEILVSALGLAIKDWNARGRILLNLESPGRKEILEGIDITRTVGDFTSRYPVVLEIEDYLEMHIIQTKEQLRRIAEKGVGYGILRYGSDLPEEEKSKLQLTPEICFKYLCQIDNDSHCFGVSMSEESHLLAGITIACIMSRGKLIFTFNRDARKYKDEDVRNLIGSFERRLKEIIAHCREKEEMVYTPSDFAAGDLDFEEINNIKDILLINRQ